MSFPLQYAHQPHSHAAAATRTTTAATAATAAIASGTPAATVSTSTRAGFSAGDSANSSSSADAGSNTDRAGSPGRTPSTGGAGSRGRAGSTVAAASAGIGNGRVRGLPGLCRGCCGAVVRGGRGVGCGAWAISATVAASLAPPALLPPVPAALPGSTSSSFSLAAAAGATEAAAAVAAPPQSPTGWRERLLQNSCLRRTLPPHGHCSPHPRRCRGAHAHTHSHAYSLATPPSITPSVWKSAAVASALALSHPLSPPPHARASPLQGKHTVAGMATSPLPHPPEAAATLSANNDGVVTANGSAAAHAVSVAASDGDAEAAAAAAAATAQLEARLDEVRAVFGKKEGDPLRIVGVGAGAWGSVFVALLKESYGQFKGKVDVRIWRRPSRPLDKDTAVTLFKVINEREDVLRRLIRKCAYLKYVEARLGDRTLYADEVLRDGFCVNVLDTPLCPFNVVTNLQEAVWDADVVINGLPSTETRGVFREIGRAWRERSKPPPVVVSLAKGVEAGWDPEPHMVTPTLMIHQEAGVPMERVLYLGGPNIASEIYHREYANARLCGGSPRWRKALAALFRQRNFIVWDNDDLVTHEVMGGLKNVYAIGAGIVAGATGESATSKSVYFAHATSEMIFVTQMLSPSPERLAGPLLADTYVTLLKGRNAWYGQQLASGALTPAMGDSVKGKGLIQGVSAVAAFHEVLSHPIFKVPHPITNEMVPPVELCPILHSLYRILHLRDCPPAAILDTLRDENMYDPAQRIAVAPQRCYLSKLLDKHPSSKDMHAAASAAAALVQEQHPVQPVPLPASAIASDSATSSGPRG